MFPPPSHFNAHLAQPYPMPLTYIAQEGPAREEEEEMLFLLLLFQEFQAPHREAREHEVKAHLLLRFLSN